MHIFIMRHGEAEHQFQNDRDRSLTSQGRQESAESGQWLRDYCAQESVLLSQILVSPYRRAQQTFEAMTPHLEAPDPLTSSDIVPSGDAELAHSHIDFLFREHPDSDGILLVSHMPFVSYLLDTLSGVHHSTLFSTGSIAVLDYNLETGRGTVLEHFTPHT